MAKRAFYYPIENTGAIYTAYYEPSQEDKFKGIKTIEALPWLERKDVLFRLEQLPDFEPSDRNKSAEFRILKTNLAIYEYYKPLIKDVNYAMNFYQAIRMGYVNRNVEDPEYHEKVKKIVGELKKIWKKEEKDRSNVISRYPVTHINTENKTESRHSPTKELSLPDQKILIPKKYKYHSDPDNQLVANDGLSDHFGYSVIGQSGIGKTRATRKVALSIPQLLYHPHFDGPLLQGWQLVWHRMKCPHDGSIKALCEGFIAGISGLTGIDFFDYYVNQRHTTSDLMRAMASLCVFLQIGVLVLDDAEKLVHSRGQKLEWTTNFLNDLTHWLNIPIIIIGTYESEPILKSFYRARRSIGQPESYWNPLPYCSFDETNPIDESWRLFFGGLMEYQYIRNPIEKTDDWSKFFHDKSCGIIDVAQKLFMSSQTRAIQSGTETITKDLVDFVYEDYFLRIDKYLDPMRNKNFLKLAEFSDYPISTIRIFEILEKRRELEAITIETSEKSLLSRDNDSSESLEESTNDERSNELHQQAVLSTSPDFEEENPDNDKATWPGDQSYKIRKGVKRGLTPVEAFEKEGFITDPIELISSLRDDNLDNK